jgi:fumarylacetoacetate (FAA) hydrolase
MKLVSYIHQGHQSLGLLHAGKVLNLPDAAERRGHSLPNRMEDYLAALPNSDRTARIFDQRLKAGEEDAHTVVVQSVHLLAPLPKPTSCRDGYAFRQHVAAARRNRGVEMIAEFDQYPIFYFTNHNAILGPGPIPCMADHFQKLDFELEAAIVVGKHGRNIAADEADEYIYGLTVMNDMSARTLQMEEMLLNLGPAKGKDFATTIGPCLVTLDELQAYEVPAKAGHVGKSWNLPMRARVNGIEVSAGNVSDMDWTFAEILERCAYGVDIYPGDLIGSGTVGTGCFLELNGTAKLNDPNAVPQWLKEGDVVEMEIDHLGTLVNTIVREDDFSILALKK